MPAKREGSPYWQIVIRGRRQSSRIKDFKAAKILEDRLNTEAELAHALGLRFSVWDDAVISWFKENRSLKSIYISRQQSRWWEQYLQGRRLNTITGDYVRGVILENRPVDETGPSPKNSTANLYIDFVRKILRHAGVTFKCKPFPRMGGRTEWLTMEHWRQLSLNTHMSTELRQVATFSISTGLRRGNVIGLQWAWIAGATLQVPASFTKTATPYGIPLCKTALRVLDQRRQASVRSPVHVFLMDGEPIYPVKLHRAWNSVLKASGVPHIPYHGLRHTYASWMVQAGVPFEIVARLGNWKCKGLVHRYSHFDVESLRPWAEKFDEIVNTLDAQIIVSRG